MGKTELEIGEGNSVQCSGAADELRSCTLKKFLDFENKQRRVASKLLIVDSVLCSFAG